ncbi:hypothetical protein GCM10009116_04390 [Brevundimonas basaltis]
MGYVLWQVLNRSGVRVVENVFHRPREQHGDPVSEVQRRIVFLGLQRIHGLPGHAQRLTELFLGPAALDAQQLQPVLHRLLLTKGAMTPKQAQNSG